jgi:hypothetical protein
LASPIALRGNMMDDYMMHSFIWSIGPSAMGNGRDIGNREMEMATGQWKSVIGKWKGEM